MLAPEDPDDAGDAGFASDEDGSGSRRRGRSSHQPIWAAVMLR